MKKTRVTHIRNNNHDVYIGRNRASQPAITSPSSDTDLVELGLSGYFCNPYKLQPGQKPGATLPKYKHYFLSRLKYDDMFKHQIHRLRGKTLGCFCSPDTCHGSIISTYLNKY